MMIILDRYAIPDKGTFEIRQLVTLELSAEQARKIVNHFLLMEVSTMLAADAPDLVIGDQTVWRVPVWIGFLQQGRFQAGVMDVDVKTGAILNQDERTAAIQARAAELAAGMPPYIPNPTVADEFLAADPIGAEENVLRLNLVPVNPPEKRRTAGLHKGAIQINADFNDPLCEAEQDMTERVVRNDWTQFEAILKRVPDNEPEPGDRLD